MRRLERVSEPTCPALSLPRARRRDYDLTFGTGVGVDGPYQDTFGKGMRDVRYDAEDVHLVGHLSWSHGQGRSKCPQRLWHKDSTITTSEKRRKELALGFYTSSEGSTVHVRAASAAKQPSGFWRFSVPDSAWAWFLWLQENITRSRRSSLLWPTPLGSGLRTPAGLVCLVHRLPTGLPLRQRAS